MKMKYGSLSCKISAHKNMEIHCEVLCDLEPDTVYYAISRFFTKDTSVCHSYVKESYQMRLAKGKGRKAKHHRCILPALLAELPGMWVQVYFMVDAEGVIIQRIQLLERYPGL